MPLGHEPLPGQIDHVIAIQHGGRTTSDNLALACAHCNTHKGPDIAGIDPLDGTVIRLFDPRQDRWMDHFRFEGAMVIAKTAVARTTIRTLAINDPLRMSFRLTLMPDGDF